MFETWTCSNRNVELNGYITYNFYKKYQHKRARRCSGGVVLYYREHLRHGIEIVKNICDTVIWIKLKRDFFNLENDVYLCGTYLWGEDSPAYNIIDIDLFESLENDIAYFQELGNVFVTGDLNSRVGNNSDFIVCDNYNMYTDSEGYIADHTPGRASDDKSLNGHGLRLLDLCKSSTIRIVNGRVGNTGQFTFHSRNGYSVIDYLLTHEHNFSMLCDFNIGPFNEWSDHAPLHFSIKCNNTLPLQNTFTETKYRWDNTLRDEFRSGVISHLPDFNNIVNNIDCTNKQSINNAVQSFTDTLRSITDPLFSKCFRSSNKPSFTEKSYMKNADWFDVECSDARRTYLEALRVFNLNKNNENRNDLFDKKSIYKKLINKKKGAFYRSKMRDIENLKNKKPKDFWKFFKKDKKTSTK